MTVHLRLEPPVSFILRQSGAFRRELENLHPLWELFKPTMSRIERERFESEGHGEWPALADSTIRDRAIHGFGAGPILHRTGDLEDSLVDPNRAANVGRMQMTWGTNVSHAHWHQDGGTVAGRPPQRVILDLRTEDRRMLERDQVRFINEAAARTWGRI